MIGRARSSRATMKSLGDNELVAAVLVPAAKLDARDHNGCWRFVAACMGLRSSCDDRHARAGIDGESAQVLAAVELGRRTYRTRQRASSCSRRAMRRHCCRSRCAARRAVRPGAAFDTKHRARATVWRGSGRRDGRSRAKSFEAAWLRSSSCLQPPSGDPNPSPDDGADAAAGGGGPRHGYRVVDHIIPPTSATGASRKWDTCEQALSPRCSAAADPAQEKPIQLLIGRRQGRRPIIHLYVQSSLFRLFFWHLGRHAARSAARCRPAAR